MEGKVTTGEGRAADFVAANEDLIVDAVGFSPYPGTLNLEDVDDLRGWDQFTVPHDDDFCEKITFIPCRIAGVRCAVIHPYVPDYPVEKTELLCPVQLRKLFSVDDGDVLHLQAPEDVWPPSSRSAIPDAFDLFDGIVFDLDQTLVELDVDWEEVQEELNHQYGSHFKGGVSEYSMTELYDVARSEAFYDELLELLSTVETEGIDTTTALPLSRYACSLDQPVAICTANSVGVAWKVLEKFDIADNVDTVIGRETLDKQKPAPEPLYRSLESISVEPGNAVFVGDSRSDARAAQAARTSYLHPKQIA